MEGAPPPPRRFLQQRNSQFENPLLRLINTRGKERNECILALLESCLTKYPYTRCLQEAARTRAGHNASVFSPLFYLLIHRHFRNRFYSFIAPPPLPPSSFFHPIRNSTLSLPGSELTKARFRLRVSFHARKLGGGGEEEVKFSWKLSSCRGQTTTSIIRMIWREQGGRGLLGSPSEIRLYLLAPFRYIMHGVNSWIGLCSPSRSASRIDQVEPFR